MFEMVIVYELSNFINLDSEVKGLPGKERQQEALRFGLRKALCL